MKILLLIACLLLPTITLAANDYDNDYCKDPVELQKWDTLLEENPDSDTVATLHALWIGLCTKVGAHTLTTERANDIFENFRWRLIIDVIEAGAEDPEKESK